MRLGDAPDIEPETELMQKERESPGRITGPDGREEIERFRLFFESTLGIPFTAGNLVEPLRNGVRIFPAMLRAIGDAFDTIELLTFVYWHGEIADRFADALAAKAREGLEVRVLLDALGCLPMRKELIERMEGAGVTVRQFRPLHRLRFWDVGHRTHRKILVCDGRVGFTGGVGIAEEWEGDARGPEEWRETHFQIEGPAVHGLQGAFLENWLETEPAIEIAYRRARPLAAAGSSLAQVLRTSAVGPWSDAITVLRLIMESTRRRLRIATAYFVPDEPAIELLRGCTRRGVDVEILLPGEHCDHRSCELAAEDVYAPLLDAGVRIWTYRPTMLHAKIITSDGVLSLIGSLNFNQRSMHQDDEIAIVVLDQGIARSLDEHFEEDLQSSDEVPPKLWRRRGPVQRGLEGLSRLVRPQL